MSRTCSSLSLICQAKLGRWQEGKKTIQNWIEILKFRLELGYTLITEYGYQPVESA